MVKGSRLVLETSIAEILSSQARSPKSPALVHAMYVFGILRLNFLKKKNLLKNKMLLEKKKGFKCSYQKLQVKN